MSSICSFSNLITFDSLLLLVHFCNFVLYYFKHFIIILCFISDHFSV